MDHRIIGITRKGALREVALHPAVKGIVHEQIHQDRTDHSPLRSSAIPRRAGTLRSLEWRSQPPLDVQQDPVFLDVLAYRLEHEAVIDLIEGRFDIKLHHPVVLPAPLSGDGYRLFGRSPGPVSIRIRMEQGIENRFDEELSLIHISE